MVGSLGKKHLLLIAIVISLNFTRLSGLQILSESGRFLAETGNGSNPDSSRIVDDTVRVDPLDNFKKYRGGYDIRNKHYWASTAFTGLPGFAIAVIWLVCGLGYGGFLLVAKVCRSSRKLKKQKRSPCHKQCYLIPLLLSVFFTILAITASGLVLGANAKFNSRAKTIIDIIIDTADEASDTIYKTTGAMKEMSTKLEDVDGSSDATDFLTSTSTRLDSQASDIARQASKHRNLIHKGLKIVYIVTTVAISLTLVAAVALLVFSVLKFRRTLQILIGLCWILTALCFLFFGVYHFLQNFAGDTCTALESFQKDPYNNSLSSILPCDELLSAESILVDVSSGIYDLVEEVNENITRSYGNIVQICNPFSATHEYEPWNCPSTSIRIGDIPQVLRMLACPDYRGATCNGGILVPPDYYNMVEAYSTSIQKLLDVYPGMESLVECQTVEDAFSDILQDHCGRLKRDVRTLWASLVFLSVVMVALVVLSTVVQVHDNKNNHFLGGSSVKPHSAASPDHMMESGAAETTNNESESGLV